MTNLNKPIKRVSAGIVKEAGMDREVVVILRPRTSSGFGPRDADVNISLLPRSVIRWRSRHMSRTSEGKNRKNVKSKGGKLNE
jgi:hypothetical protein